MMEKNEILNLLKANPQVSDYKINTLKKESFELFYVKGKLETSRATDTQDCQVTVYADHDGFRGDSQFYVYPSTTAAELTEKIEEAVSNAGMIKNPPYTLPEKAQCEISLPSNLGEEPMPLLADRIARQVFAANTQEGGSLNSVEIFINHYTESIENSLGLHKIQHSYSAMVEAIPTFNGDRESVELYEQYNFSALDPQDLLQEISEKMDGVKARYEAVKPDFSMDCKVVLHKQELSEFFTALSEDLDYATVYNHGNRFQKGDDLQPGRRGDALTLTMKGSVPGNVASASFDSDGLNLNKITLIQDGVVKNYFGSNRFGQYLKEEPTGSLGCICVSPGTFGGLKGKAYLEVLSMSGLQVDFFNDYIGGEIRLAYYHDGEKKLPVTGISIAGKVSEVMKGIHFSSSLATFDSYTGPATAMLEGLQIF